MCNFALLLVASYKQLETRMTLFIKAKLEKSDDIVKYRVAANVAENHIVSKLIFLKIIISKFMMKRQ